MKSSLMALGSNLLVNLNICKAIRWMQLIDDTHIRLKKLHFV